MRQTAQVTKNIAPGYVEVRIRRQSACASAHNCGSCDACALMSNAPEITVVARDDRDHGVGETVVVESETSRVLGAAVVLYILPFLLFFLGYLLGRGIGGKEGMSLLLGGGGFCLGLLCAFLLDRRLKKRPMQYRVVSAG